MTSNDERPDPSDDKKPPGLLRRLKNWIGRTAREMDATEKAIDQAAKELKEKNARGTRRTDGRL